MQRSKLIALVDTQSFSDEEALNDVAALAGRHPWCSSFQVLKAIGLRQLDALEAREQLNLASLYINDRSKLYSYTVRPNLLAHIDKAQAGVEVPASAKMEHGESIGAIQGSGIEQPTNAEENIDGRQGDRSAEGSEALSHKEAAVANDREPEKNEALLDIAPLESQILAEAMTHLGELEWQTQLETAPVQHPDSTQADESPGDGSTKKQNAGHLAGYTGGSKFSKWLLSLDGRDECHEKEAADETQGVPAAASTQLIEKFIQESPQISPAKANFFSPSQMGKMSLVEDESFVSETLAKIYERQGDYKKAVRAYQQLSLKYPEKSVYFAALQKKAEAQI